MFIFLLKYTKGLEAVDRVMPEHRKFLDEHYEKGNFICSGRRKPRTGGVILCKAGSFAEAKNITERDPFVVEDIAEYEIIEFEISKSAPGFETFIK